MRTMPKLGDRVAWAYGLKKGQEGTVIGHGRGLLVRIRWDDSSYSWSHPEELKRAKIK